MKILVDKGYITQEWVDFAPEAFQYFYDQIGVQLAGNPNTVFPETANIFRAFKECPPDQLKVVILGQDPYFDGSATGLAFDNNYAKKGGASPSLKKIMKEIASDIYQTDLHGYSELKSNFNKTSVLEHLPKQGVLLWNTALTVEQNKPLSHVELWAPFTDLIIKAINRKPNIVWILWGAYAKSYSSRVGDTHKVIEGTHPAARPNVAIKFEGGKYFSRCNELLTAMSHAPINW